MNALALRKRLKAAIQRAGEPYTPFGGAPRVAVFSAINRSATLTYVPIEVVNELDRPILMAHAPWDDPTAKGVSLTWRARTLKVQAVMDVRFAGETVARLFVTA
ncbi:MAG: hypothetical protein C4320_05330 [Armatimonadota bacterium]